MFLANNVIPLPRLVALGILVLLVRRLPWVYAIHKKIPQIEQKRQAIFVGFFGPVGVSAIFYLYITLEFLDTLRAADDSGDLRSDIAQLPEAVIVVVWFLCICSVVSLAHAKYLFSAAYTIPLFFPLRVVNLMHSLDLTSFEHQLAFVSLIYFDFTPHCVVASFVCDVPLTTHSRSSTA